MNMLSPTAANGPGLRRFVGADLPSPKCYFILPHFKGGASLENDGVFAQPLSYRGFTFAERDSRAAFYVHSLVAPVFDAENIAIEPATSGRQVMPTAFLFGSRSNLMTQEVLQASGRGLFEFEFGSLWKVRCADKEFSIPDPSEIMDPDQYQNTTDYAVIARLHVSGSNLAFVIAGLVGRATEGAAQFFVKNWQQMAASYGEDDFAAVLQFDVPFQLDNCRIVASAQRSASQLSYA